MLLKKELICELLEKDHETLKHIVKQPLAQNNQRNWDNFSWVSAVVCIWTFLKHFAKFSMVEFANVFLSHENERKAQKYFSLSAIKENLIPSDPSRTELFWRPGLNTFLKEYCTKDGAAPGNWSIHHRNQRIMVKVPLQNL